MEIRKNEQEPNENKGGVGLESCFWWLKAFALAEHCALSAVLLSGMLQHLHAGNMFGLGESASDD